MKNVTPRKMRRHAKRIVTVPDLLADRLKRLPNSPVLYEPEPLGDGWLPLTMRDLDSRIRKIARGLIGMGFQRGDAIGIMGATSLEWCLLDLACALSGLVVVPIYQTDSASQLEWILEDANVRGVFVDTADRRELVSSKATDQVIVMLDAEGLSQVETHATAVTEDDLDARIRGISGDTLYSIVYTSGTTGRPKGVELTHSNFTYICLGAREWSPRLVMNPQTRLLQFLPLAHVMGRIITLICIGGSAQVAFAPNIHNLTHDLHMFQPTLLVVVPRVLEKVYNAAEAKAGAGLGRRIFKWAASVAERNSQKHFHGPLFRLERRLADRLVLSKIRYAVGGKVSGIISAGAPLGNDLSHFYGGIGMPVTEIYGLTETLGSGTVQDWGKAVPGNLGRTFPGTRVRIAEDGEIQIKGPGVFRRYHNNAEATAAAFEDGWFLSGDLGSVNKNGALEIIGRKKHLIVTAGGKNVAPDVLQDALASHPLISQIMVIGDRKPFIAALITLDAQLLPGWLRAHKLPPMSTAEARVHPAVLASLQRGIDRANAHVSRAESIRKFEVLPGDFTEENGMLTPSMKVRREVVLKNFADVVDRIYAAKK